MANDSSDQYWVIAGDEVSSTVREMRLFSLVVLFGLAFYLESIPNSLEPAENGSLTEDTPWELGG